jgi:tRNA-splicing ligase RtcB
MFEIKGKYTTARVMIDDVEQECVSQINTFVNHPAFTNQIAIMPDTHSGKGSVIGFTMPMTNKLIANTIGVDVGCGVLSVNIGNVLPIAFEQLDHKIRQRVPFGFSTHDKSVIDMSKEFPWSSVNTLAHNFSLAYNQKFRTNYYAAKYDYNWFMDKLNKIGASPSRVLKSIGTLGGG